MSIMDIEEIRRYLPHRYPFLLIDRVTDIEVGKYIKDIKNVSANEPFFQGHFPGKAVMPGVLVIEAMAQAAGILGVKSGRKELGLPDIPDWPDANDLVAKYPELVQSIVALRQ